MLVGFALQVVALKYGELALVEPLLVCDLIFAAVINSPHGGILAVGAGEPRPVVKNGALTVATVMSCTLSCDHRAVDGAIGAQFLAAFKKLVEDPLRMLL